MHKAMKYQKILFLILFTVIPVGFFEFSNTSSKIHIYIEINLA